MLRIALILALLCTASTLAQPLPSQYFTAAYDSRRAKGVFFADYDFRTPGFGHTWEWDGSDWSQRTPQTSPTIQAGVLLYDDAHDTMLLAGTAGSGAPFSTSLWNGQSWTVSQSTSGPPSRGFAPVAFDFAHERVLLFGGTTHIDGHAGLANDTWTWDGTTWVQRDLTRSPTPIHVPTIVYDHSRDAPLLFRVEQATDLWELVGDSWEPIAPTTPIALTSQDYLLCSDPIRKRILALGRRQRGEVVPLGQPSHLPDTWEWDGQGWIRQQPEESPPARAGGVMFFDESTGSIILFGGDEYVQGDVGTVRRRLSDTWAWNGHAWHQVGPPGNRSPIVVPATDGATRLGNLVDLSATAEDLDGDEISYFWSFRSSPDSSLELVEPKSASASFSPTVTGTYVLSVVATDGRGGYGIAHMSVTVAPRLSCPGPEQATIRLRAGLNNIAIPLMPCGSWAAKLMSPDFGAVAGNPVVAHLRGWYSIALVDWS